MEKKSDYRPVIDRKQKPAPKLGKFEMMNGLKKPICGKIIKA
jgi:hypothetical protein